MRHPILGLMIFLAGTATPVFASTGIGYGNVQVKNATPFPVQVTIMHQLTELIDARLEPEETVTVIPQRASKKRSSGDPSYGLIKAVGLEYPIQDQETSAVLVLPDQGECNRYDVELNQQNFLVISVFADSCSAALRRETRVLACSAFGFLFLGCVGHWLGRAPRRREQ